MSKELLDLRKKNKSKKPNFLRQDAHRVKRLKKKWQRPRGLQSKMRLGFRGYRRLVNIGYCSPAQVRGFSPEGLKPVLVRNLGDLEKLDGKINGVVLASSLSMKKRTIIVSAALEKKITILNMKQPENYGGLVEKKLSQRKKQRIVSKAKKNKKKEEKPAKPAPKKSEKAKEPKESKEQKNEEPAQEEGKDKQKEEKDKVLTKKGVGY